MKFATALLCFALVLGTAQAQTVTDKQQDIAVATDQHRQDVRTDEVAGKLNDQSDAAFRQMVAQQNFYIQVMTVLTPVMLAVIMIFQAWAGRQRKHDQDENRGDRKANQDENRANLASMAESINGLSTSRAAVAREAGYSEALAGRTVRGDELAQASRDAGQQSADASAKATADIKAHPNGRK